jgi:taurine dioxygenase
MQLHKTTGALGAEITSIDLADGRPETAQAVFRAAVEKRMIVVRGPSFPVDRQLALTRSLSDEIYLVKNPAKGGYPTDNWHTDATTSERPPSLTILVARTLPTIGGDTLFVDMVNAYERLSEQYRQMLRGQRLVHANRLFNPANPIVQVHPIVRTIPDTGERALYCGFPGIAESIEGMTPAESRPILDFLFQHAVCPDAIYRHHWQADDVVIWDNRSTMHLAVHDYGEEDRFLTRSMIQGEAPYDAANPD